MNPRFDTLVIATKNPAKERRYTVILSMYATRIIGLKNFVIAGRPEEFGETAEENAEIKANFYSKQTGFSVFAEDEALYVDFIAKEIQPGVHVRRINGKDEANDGQLLIYWEKIIANIPMSERTGRWHVAYCFARPDGIIKTFSLDFPIIFFSPSSPVKIPGWPMSSLEGPMDFNKPHSELTKEEQQLLNCKIDQAVAKSIEEIAV